MMSAVKLYIQAYNLSQLIGWMWILFKGLQSVVQGELAVFETVRVPLFVFQMMMFLDVVNPMLGLAHGSPVAAFPQVMSRALHLLVQVLVPQSPYIIGVLLPWSSTEVIRYTMYLYQGFGIKPPYAILFLRYSWFIIIYPLGVTMEWVVIYDAWPIISACCPRIYSLTMPNEWNFAFDFKWFITWFLLPTYTVGLPMLYSHMWSQRNSKLKPN